MRTVCPKTVGRKPLGRRERTFDELVDG